MTKREKEEIEKLPGKYRPMGAWGYVGYSILMSIPLVGFILCIVFALDSSYIVRRSYARGMLLTELLACLILILIVWAATAIVSFYFGGWEQMMQAFAEYWQTFMDGGVPATE